MASLVTFLFHINPTNFKIFASLLWIFDAILCTMVIRKIPYTEIDWSTYMQQVNCYERGIRNYSKIEGDTGPVVYPAGHIWFYLALSRTTSAGRDVRTAQYIFQFLYLTGLLLVFRIYYMSQRLPPFVLIILCCISYRIHSIYLLRLFNDPIAMLFFYFAVNLWISRHFLIGSIFYSLAVSVKMNTLLFSPALLFILLLNTGYWKTFKTIVLCGIVQVVLALPFLFHDPFSYLRRSFDLGRVFLFKWTVNWRFLPEAIFLNQQFHIALLIAHIVLLFLAGCLWFRRYGGYMRVFSIVSYGKLLLTTNEMLVALFTANLIGICVARSLHYQFYSWYFYTLPYLLFSGLPFNNDWLFKGDSVQKMIFRLSSSRVIFHLLHNFSVNSVICTVTMLHKGKGINKRFLCTISEGTIIFDREAKKIQRNRAAQLDDYDVCKYVKDEIAYRVADKVFDLTKFNDVCIDIGCGSGHIAANLIKENVGAIVQCDISAGLIKRSQDLVDSEVPVLSVIADESVVPFHEKSADLVVSSLSAHWINDLAKWFSRCLSILRPDCPLIGAMLANETLHELRIALQLAELERLGGIGLHISPFVRADDVGSLLSRAGFGMITLDTDELTVGYPNIFALLYDLQSMGESNALRNRATHIRRDILIAADAIYRSMFSRDGIPCPATFQIVSFIGWRPGPLMPKPAKRGSQQASFKDIGKIIEGKIPFPEQCNIK
uniref:dolichyl-P-Man:Man5GlcNAc2-PP-dolichol alpha-1,3-mannosyltransferase n=1 Tax=Setaria digitata TaxID=48799 RepID=A0A915PWB5_9BILA